MKHKEDKGKSNHITIIEAEFNRKALHYESNRLANWYQAQGEQILHQITSLDGAVIDVGCGTGWLLRRLIKQNPYATCIGIDLSKQMIEQAKIKMHVERLNNVSFIHGDWEDAAIIEKVRDRLDQPVSKIVCVSSFHYFRHPEIAVRSMHDLLAPNGSLFLLDRAMDGSIGTFTWDFLHRYLIKDQVRFYKTSELVSLLEKTGFENVRVLKKINRWLWKQKLYTSLALVSGIRGVTPVEAS